MSSKRGERRNDWGAFKFYLRREERGKDHRTIELKLKEKDQGNNNSNLNSKINIPKKQKLEFELELEGETRVATT